MLTRLIILGCGNSIGVPTIDGIWGKCNRKNTKNIRSRCSAIILKGSNSILIDTSPDIKKQLISNNIKDLTSVIYTHEHIDQTGGIFELRPFFWKYNKKMNIYGSISTINSLKKRYDFCFKSGQGYPAIVKANIIKKSFTLGSSNEKIKFKTLQVKHGNIKNTAYIFENSAYISDCNDLSIVNKSVLKGLKFLVIDCLKFIKHPTHFNLDESIYVHNKLNPKATILTNLHHDIDYDYLFKKLPKNIIPAYDGMKLGL